MELLSLPGFPNLEDMEINLFQRYLSLEKPVNEFCDC